MERATYEKKEKYPSPLWAKLYICLGKGVYIKTACRIVGSSCSLRTVVRESLFRHSCTFGLGNSADTLGNPVNRNSLMYNRP
ncbi:hypothetical protein GDO81_008278 [Engystomops pustulosus]|uniref:Uncharacterized protein n=1 Tax=Engystomops pustulosus TaxID=76066 RepID=A0AAV7CEE0_ENGPU|nr:hypothetical protein GDO81_008278 [Engystomops pustulosus]